MTARKIDHLVLPVGDLARARERLSSLGFTVAPDGHHPFGTANACIFLEDGTYLEPLALTDRRKAGAAVKRGNVFIERDLAYRGRRGRQGLSAIVVSSDDAASDHQHYIASGISGGEPLEFARAVKSPDGEETEGRFRLAFAAMNGAPDFFAFACQRVVSFPQDMGGLRTHENAVSGLKEVVLASDDPHASSSFFENLLGTSGNEVEGGLAFQTEAGRVRVLGGEQIAHEFGVSGDAAIGGLTGQAVIFRSLDLAVTEIILAANDVAFIRRDGRVLVLPSPGQGVLFGFEE
ncbi:VOC family protein [Aliirhizobium smilacinae]|uniref:VOC family protein n=1 Tax=Aliirhizobium smilacinae TaxID=1395944 RepID=A0A5C4XFC2_9HYPH|nr:VOC family protein [Rhizobium smilacinae]TNM62176.1 VOC family protein [Rhizobium smilacinae]